MLAVFVTASGAISVAESIFGRAARMFHFGFFLANLLATLGLHALLVLPGNHDEMGWGFYLYLVSSSLFFAVTAMCSPDSRGIPLSDTGPSS